MPTIYREITTFDTGNTPTRRLLPLSGGGNASSPSQSNNDGSSSSSGGGVVTGNDAASQLSEENNGAVAAGTSYRSNNSAGETIDLTVDTSSEEEGEGDGEDDDDEEDEEEERVSRGSGDGSGAGARKRLRDGGVISGDKRNDGAKKIRPSAVCIPSNTPNPSPPPVSPATVKITLFIPAGKWNANIRAHISTTKTLMGFLVKHVPSSSIVFGKIKDEDILVAIDGKEVVGMDYGEAKVMLKKSMDKHKLVTVMRKKELVTSAVKKSLLLNQSNSVKPIAPAVRKSTAPAAIPPSTSQNIADVAALIQRNSFLETPIPVPPHPSRANHPITPTTAPEASSSFPSASSPPLKLTIPNLRRRIREYDWVSLLNMEMFHVSSNQPLRRGYRPGGPIGLRCKRCAAVNIPNKKHLYPHCQMASANLEGLEEAFEVITTRHFPQCPYLSGSTRTRLQKAKEDDNQSQATGMSIKEYFRAVAERYMIDDYGTYIGFRPYDTAHNTPTKPAVPAVPPMTTMTAAPTSDKTDTIPKKPTPTPTKIKKKEIVRKSPTNRQTETPNPLSAKNTSSPNVDGTNTAQNTIATSLPPPTPATTPARLKSSSPGVSTASTPRRNSASTVSPDFQSMLNQKNITMAATLLQQKTRQQMLRTTRTSPSLAQPDQPPAPQKTQLQQRQQTQLQQQHQPTKPSSTKKKNPPIIPPQKVPTQQQNSQSLPATPTLPPVPTPTNLSRHSSNPDNLLLYHKLSHCQSSTINSILQHSQITNQAPLSEDASRLRELNTLRHATAQAVATKVGNTQPMMTELPSNAQQPKKQKEDATKTIDLDSHLQRLLTRSCLNNLNLTSVGAKAVMADEQRRRILNQKSNENVALPQSQLQQQQQQERLIPKPMAVKHVNTTPVAAAPIPTSATAAKAPQDKPTKANSKIMPKGSSTHVEQDAAIAMPPLHVPNNETTTVTAGVPNDSGKVDATGTVSSPLTRQDETTPNEESRPENVSAKDGNKNKTGSIEMPKTSTQLPSSTNADKTTDDNTTTVPPPPSPPADDFAATTTEPTSEADQPAGAVVVPPPNRRRAMPHRIVYLYCKNMKELPACTDVNNVDDPSLPTQTTAPSIDDENENENRATADTPSKTDLEEESTEKNTDEDDTITEFTPTPDTPQMPPLASITLKATTKSPPKESDMSPQPVPDKKSKNTKDAPVPSPEDNSLKSSQKITTPAPKPPIVSSPDEAGGLTSKEREAICTNAANADSHKQEESTMTATVGDKHDVLTACTETFTQSNKTSDTTAAGLGNKTTDDKNRNTAVNDGIQEKIKTVPNLSTVISKVVNKNEPIVDCNNPKPIDKSTNATSIPPIGDNQRCNQSTDTAPLVKSNTENAARNKLPTLEPITSNDETRTAVKTKNQLPTGMANKQEQQQRALLTSRSELCVTAASSVINSIIPNFSNEKDSSKAKHDVVPENLPSDVSNSNTVPTAMNTKRNEANVATGPNVLGGSDTLKLPQETVGQQDKYESDMGSSVQQGTTAVVANDDSNRSNSRSGDKHDSPEAIISEAVPPTTESCATSTDGGNATATESHEALESLPQTQEKGQLPLEKSTPTTPRAVVNNANVIAETKSFHEQQQQQTLVLDNNDLSTCPAEVPHKQQKHEPLARTTTIAAATTSTKAIRQINATPTPTKSTQKLPKTRDCLVFPQDKNYVSDFVFFLLQQLRPTIHSTRAGVECRHCINTGPEAFRIFPSSVRRFRTCITQMHAHLMSCRHAPFSLKKRLCVLKDQETREYTKIKPSRQDQLYGRVWDRVQGRECVEEGEEIEEDQQQEQQGEGLMERLPVEGDSSAADSVCMSPLSTISKGTDTVTSIYNSKQKDTTPATATAPTTPAKSTSSASVDSNSCLEERNEPSIQVQAPATPCQQSTPITSISDCTTTGTTQSNSDNNNDAITPAMPQDEIRPDAVVSSSTFARRSILDKKRKRNSTGNANKNSLVSKSDKNYVSEFIFLLLEQVQPCNVTISDTGGLLSPQQPPHVTSNSTTNNNNTHSPPPPSSRSRIGIGCKHCSLETYPFKLFPTSVRRFRTCITQMHDHVMHCKQAPFFLKKKLCSLKDKETREYTKIKPSRQNEFYDRIWDRLSRMPSGSGSAGVEDEEDTMSRGSTGSSTGVLETLNRHSTGSSTGNTNKKIRLDSFRFRTSAKMKSKSLSMQVPRRDVDI
mmetsp:Transcript_5364/g.6698  ORF Transcript_5364/g.6698 Transcript_5364/m.6698 type:complete len:2191 (-) Transcript_5364:85-6657(-)|eukprot:CAMPEP_0172510322 /NCGR_PEP_ID=MMETSP1066-20121228/227771_1 /TAXON_ID=671091 /ORGANISM="Coscinodiscus wailesii, Strain CCMP2513" /LENGTH=2190 /DNA_ID=CAMNT_0013289231 /DNA_START=312 /DNA_END=6884 /DNA_ORIENTATION=-